MNSPETIEAQHGSTGSQNPETGAGNPDGKQGQRIRIRRAGAISLSAALLLGLSFAYAQETGQPPQKGAPGTPEYRVMHRSALFEGDEEAKKKIAELSVTVTGGSNQVTVRRTDMDSSDCERALNRWAKEGWTLVTVNKSNYWVFKRTRTDDAPQ